MSRDPVAEWFGDADEVESDEEMFSDPWKAQGDEPDEDPGVWPPEDV